MQPIATRTFGKTKIVFDYDSYPEDPSSYMGTEICIREHRRYHFANTRLFPFALYDERDDLDQEDKATLDSFFDGWWAFSLDCYEHGNVSFSISGKGTQCAFDTSRGCGFAFVDKKCFEDEATALAEAEESIGRYSAYVNGEVYEFRIYTVFDTIEKDDKTYETDDEYECSFSGAYSGEGAFYLTDLRSYVDESHWDELEKFVNEVL